jgi:hypothetical protein
MSGWIIVALSPVVGFGFHTGQIIAKVAWLWVFDR